MTTDGTATATANVIATAADEMAPGTAAAVGARVGTGTPTTGTEIRIAAGIAR